MAVGNLVALASTTTSNSGNTVSATIPNDGSVVVGDLLIWMGGVASGSRTFTVSGVSNFTFAGSAAQSGSGSHLWYKIAESGDLGATITLTPSIGGTTLEIILGKVSGADTTNPFDSPVKIASATETATTTHITPSVSSVAAGSREISILFDTRSASSPNTSNWTAPAGMTRQDQEFSADTNPRMSSAWGDSDATVSGTVGTRTWTADQSASCSRWTLAVKAGAVNFTESPSDAEGLTDSVSLVQAHVYTKSDPEGLTDNLTVALTARPTFSDSLGMTDSVTTGLSMPFTKSDPMGLTDGLSLNLFAPPVPPEPPYENSLVQGPATIYIGNYGSPEPSGATLWDPSATYWTSVGGTRGGVSIDIQQDWKTVELKQVADTTLRRLERRKITAKTTLAEPTLANVLYVLNGGTSATGSGWRTYEAPLAANESIPLSYYTILVYGWAPNFKRRLVILRKCLSSEGTQLSYKKDDQTDLTAVWSVHNVSSSITPFKIIDEA